MDRLAFLTKLSMQYHNDDGLTRQWQDLLVEPLIVADILAHPLSPYSRRDRVTAPKFSILHYEVGDWLGFKVENRGSKVGMNIVVACAWIFIAWKILTGLTGSMGVVLGGKGERTS